MPALIAWISSPRPGAETTTVVVSAPGLGDEIQAIKAGILEIADIHVVSKCDRSDANRTLVDLKQMLMLGIGKEKPEWAIPVVGTSALNGQGLDELIAAIDEHRKIAFDSETGRRRRLAIAEFRLRKTAENLLLERFGKIIDKDSAPLAAKLARRETDPYSLAAELLESSFPEGKAHEQDARSKIA